MISRGWMLIGLIMSWQTLNAEAQFHRVSGFLQDCGKDTLYLAQYYQDSYRIIDSVVLADGSFYFIFPESRHAGFYRIGTDRAGISEPDASRFRDFIYNEEDPVLYGSCKDLAKATVADSRENYLLQQYEAFEARY